MTIKELEQAVGMTRANIRFYEQEGLLSPARAANGYRDYSEADAAALEKIKLLRQLHMDLDTIRSLQRGELPLTAALERQLRQLEADQAALDRARDVCAQLRASGADYAALDAAPWLRELEKAPASERFAPPKDEAPPLPGHSWRRLFARTLDLALYSLPFTVAEVLILRFPPHLTTNFFFQLFDSYLAFALMFLLEPLLLHFWGTTPGKFVFGITLRDADGEKLSTAAARKRLGTLFAQGMGYGLPFYNLWRYYKSWKACDIGERSPWAWSADDGRAERLEIPENSWRCFAFAGAYGALLALVLVITLQGQLPPHRGPLTPEQFADNYNFYLDYLYENALHLTAEGTEEAPPGNAIAIEPFPAQVKRWSPILTGGEVTGFTYELELSTGGFLAAAFVSSAQPIGLLSYAGALPQVNCLNFHPDEWVAQLPTEQWNYDLTYRGVRVTQTARFTGVEGTPGSFIEVPEGQKVGLRLEFTVQNA